MHLSHDLGNIVVRQTQNVLTAFSLESFICIDTRI